MVVDSVVGQFQHCDHRVVRRKSVTHFFEPCRRLGPHHAIIRDPQAHLSIKLLSEILFISFQVDQ